MLVRYRQNKWKRVTLDDFVHEVGTNHHLIKISLFLTQAATPLRQRMREPSAWFVEGIGKPPLRRRHLGDPKPLTAFVLPRPNSGTLGLHYLWAIAIGQNIPFLSDSP